MPFLNIETKEDSAQKVEQLEGVDSKLYIKAEEFNKAVDAINNLDSRVSETSDKLTVDAGFSIVGTDFRLNANNKWEISGNENTSPALISKPISFATNGMKKQCIVLLNAENDFYLKYGDEHAQNPPKPTKDAGTVQLTDFTVTHTTIGVPTPIVVGDPFIIKNQFNESGDINGKFYIYQQSNFLIVNPQINVVRGLCAINGSEEGLYPGKLHYWTNLLTTPVLFPHMDISDNAVNYPFYFSDLSDMVVEPGQTIIFIHSTVNIPLPVENGYLRFVAGSGKVDTSAIEENLSNLEDLVEMLFDAIQTKQNTLVSGQNIKTFNGQSILGAGNISIPTFPPPFLEILIPDSTLPSTTTNFVLKGAFFTQNMTVSIVGQTVNYITFVSDNLVKVNVTTGPTEGNFAVTLNNGTSVTFNNALMIVLGVLYTPEVDEWTVVNNPDITERGNVNLITHNTVSTALWSRAIDFTKNFSIRFNIEKSPYGNPLSHYHNPFIELLNSDNSLLFGLWTAFDGNGCYIGSLPYGWENTIRYDLASTLLSFNRLTQDNLEIRWSNGSFALYKNNTVVRSIPNVPTQNLKLRIRVISYDVKNIKYIELAS